MTKVKPEWGAKHTCPKCGTIFYDMRKKIVVCPKCTYKFTEDDLKGFLNLKIREKLATKMEKEEPKEEEIEDIDDNEILDDEFLEEPEDLDESEARADINITSDEEV